MADARKRSPFKGLTLRLPGTAPAAKDTDPTPLAVEEDLVTDVDAMPPTDISNRGEPTHRDAESGIEIVLVREDATPRRTRLPWRALEVWTKNRVYGMDSSFNCIEVVDRATGKLDPHHPILGGRLGGGRKRGGRGQTPQSATKPPSFSRLPKPIKYFCQVLRWNSGPGVANRN